MIDRTDGSMEKIKNDVIGGFNSFISSQQREEGETVSRSISSIDNDDEWKDVK
jgi:hypothetical protein